MQQGIRLSGAFRRVKMACLGALVNVGHKNFKVQQAIHDSSAIAALVELLGESTAPFEQLQARSSRLEDGFVKRSSAGSLKAPLSRTGEPT